MLGHGWGSYRRVLVALVTLAMLPAAASADKWDQAVRAARAYANTRSGVVSFALIDDLGHLHGSRYHEGWYSASLLKPIIMGTYLNLPGVRDRRLTGAETALITPMIRRSADDPASELFTRLGIPALDRFGRRTGLTSLRVVGPIWGSTHITAGGYVRFFRNLLPSIPLEHRAYALKLLKTIVPEQRWGVPHARPPGWALAFKGGWRAGRGYGRIVNQAALLACGLHDVALTILTDRDPSHVYGTETVAGVAKRLLRPLRPCAKVRA